METGDLPVTVGTRAFDGKVDDDGYEYVVHNRDEKAIHYVCKHYKLGLCRVRATSKNDVFSINKNKKHTHPPNKQNVKIKAFKRDLYAKVINSKETFRKCYDNIRQLHEEASVSATFAQCENSMYKWRRKFTLPKVESLAAYGVLINSNEFQHLKNYRNGSLNISSAVGVNGDVSIVFVDINFANQVCQNCHLSIDATFKVVPNVPEASQFLILRAETFNHSIPFAWALMERKCTGSYTAVLEKLKRLLLNFNVVEAMCDFETALRAALRIAFFGVEIHGCLYHHVKCNWSNLRTLHLEELLIEFPECHNFIRLIMALPLLPANEIASVYRELKNSLSDEAKVLLGRFFIYYERQWINRITPSGYSVFGLTKRTNNDCESYNRTLKQRFKNQTDIWDFTKTLAEHQSGLLIDLKSLEEGNRITRLRKCNEVLKDQKIFDAWSKLSQPGGYSRRQFLEEVSIIFIDPIQTLLNEE